MTAQPTSVETGRWYMDLDELLTELMKTARDSRPADSEAAQDAREIRAEILRRFA
jgi:hypothetical protein